MTCDRFWMSIPVYITSIVSSPRCLRHVWLTQCIIISLVNYSRLVMYSFGFQHAFQRGIEASDNVFLNKVLLPCSVEDLKLIFFFFFSTVFRSCDGCDQAYDQRACTEWSHAIVSRW